MLSKSSGNKNNRTKEPSDGASYSESVTQRNTENAQRNMDVNTSFHSIPTNWKRDHPSAFSPYKPTTVLTNLQRGNVQTQTISIPLERGLHQLAAQGELFLENIEGAFDSNARDKNGFTPLMWAAAYGQLETIRQLILLDACVCAIAPSGENALLLASSAGHCLIVKELLAHGAVVDYRDKDGNTALMYATFNDHAACVHELLNAGADFTLTNEALESAYDIAVRRRSKNAQIILEKCALNLLIEAKEDT